jgi:hypothetical protein
MVLNDKQGNLLNIELFESLAFCHSLPAGRRFAPYTAHHIFQPILTSLPPPPPVEEEKGDRLS